VRRLGQVRLQEARYLAMEIKWPGASLHSRPAPFQQRTNTSCYLAIPTRGFTAAVSVFRGTPPTKPLICKIWFCKICFALPGDPIDLLQAHHAGNESKLAFAKFRFAPEDIIQMSRCSCSQMAFLSLTAIHSNQPQGKTKNPAYIPVSRVRKLFSIRYLLTPILSRLPSGRCPLYGADSLGLNAQPGFDRL